MTFPASRSSCPSGHSSRSRPPRGGSKTPTRRAALALALVLASPALAGPADQALYPAAECAALWYGREDYAKRSAYLDSDPAALAMARAFRDAAVRLNGGEAVPIDAFIAKERRYWALLTESYVYAGNRDSRKLFNDQLDRCAAFAATQPETRALH